MDKKYESARELYTAMVMLRVFLEAKSNVNDPESLARFQRQMRSISERLIKAIEAVSLAGHHDFFLKWINEAIQRKDLLIYFDQQLYTVTCQCMAVPSCAELPDGRNLKILPDLENGYRVEEIADVRGLIVWKACHLGDCN